MNDIGTQNVENARAVVTEFHRKDASPTADAPQRAQSAKTGQGGGKVLPPVSTSENSAKRAEAAQATKARTAERVHQAIAKLNDYVQSVQRDLSFSVDHESGRAIVRVIDRTTQKTIRQIPNDVALRLARNLSDQVATVAKDGSGGGADGHQLDLVNTRI